MMVNLGAAVNVIHGIRTHHAQTTGCPTWDEAGIRAALTACEGSPGSVLAAAALAAEDANLRAPSAAGFLRHWPVQAGDPPTRRQTDDCPHHPGSDRVTCRQGSDCAGTPPPTPEETAAGIALVRAARAEAPQYAPRIKPTPTQTEDHHARMQALRAELEETQCPPST